MVKKKRLALFTLVVLMSSLNYFGQPRSGDGSGGVRPIDVSTAEADNARWSSITMSRDGMLPVNIARRRSINALLLLREKANKKIKVTKAEREPYEVFLKLPDTGIFKLAPIVSCSTMVDVSKNDDHCLYYYVEGHGAAYSFRAEKHHLAQLSDIVRSDGEFSVPGFMSVGLIKMLGDEPIEGVSSSHPDAIEMARFEPASSVKTLEQQRLSIEKGVNIGSSTFLSTAPIRLGKTYLIRSVAFKTRNLEKNKLIIVPTGFSTMPRKDVTVVFRVAQITDEGGLIILWKELARGDSPVLDLTSDAQ